MLWRVELAPSTLSELKAIEAPPCQERDNAEYAQSLIEKLFARFDSLAQLPHRGTRPRLQELRHYLQVLEKPYRILYRIDEENRVVFIVAILHQTQDLLSAWRSQKRS
ncbi:type II toxin-antitoxin system RelE/ParE family toxin [bacterium]|nr:type II toxin-antitoxin system RelE/ParE family toxin [bacterium]